MNGSVSPAGSAALRAETFSQTNSIPSEEQCNRTEQNQHGLNLCELRRSPACSRLPFAQALAFVARLTSNETERMRTRERGDGIGLDEK